MEQLPRLRARIAALSDFHELIRAMEALAATHYRAAQDALQASTRHLEIVEKAIRSVSPGQQSLNAQSLDLPKHSSATVAICSEHGFVGAFNERILDRLEAEFVEGETLIVVGRRGAQIAMERAVEAAHIIPMAAHANSVPDLALQLSIETSWAGKVRIIYSRHRAESRFAVDSKVIDFGSAAVGSEPPDLERPLHHLSLERLRKDLRNDLVFATIAHCLLESLASENATRLASMQSADRNIRDKLAQLNQRERTVRQQEITEELLDILTGVESVSN